MQPNRSGGLVQLLMSLFSQQEFHRLLRMTQGFEEATDHMLPVDRPKADYFQSAAEALERRGLVAGPFFAALTNARPERCSEIAELGALFGSGHGSSFVRALRLVAPIGDQRPQISQQEMVLALGPAETIGDQLDVDLNGGPADGSDAFWREAIEHVQRVAEAATCPAEKGEPWNLRIFAWAPIPVLIALGRAIGDKQPARIFDHHRGVEDWRWDERAATKIDFIQEHFAPSELVDDVAVTLSVSSTVRPDQVEVALGVPHACYSLRVAAPTPNLICSEAQLWSFIAPWQRLWNTIHERHGAAVRVHLFAAVPISIAIECGRRLLPKALPSVRVYDFSNGEYRYALSISPRGVTY